jgi:hypothetical protein
MYHFHGIWYINLTAASGESAVLAKFQRFQEFGQTPILTIIGQELLKVPAVFKLN